MGRLSRQSKKHKEAYISLETHTHTHTHTHTQTHKHTNLQETDVDDIALALLHVIDAEIDIGIVHGAHVKGLAALLGVEVGLVQHQADLRWVWG